MVFIVYEKISNLHKSDNDGFRITKIRNLKAHFKILSEICDSSQDRTVKKYKSALK